MRALLPSSPPEWLSGHQPDSSPTCHPHVAFFPLPFVGDFNADGHVMGLAMAIPRTLILSPDQTRDAALRNVLGPLLFDNDGRERNIALWKKDQDEKQNGKEIWRWALRREMRERPPLTLRAATWTQPSRLWASVTPVVLHHYPKRDGDVERIIREAFASALLPTPKQVAVKPVSKFKGAGHARAIPEFTEGGPNLCRYQTHVVAYFSEPVLGPMLVGRGRFRGYGLFRPVKEEQ